MSSEIHYYVNCKAVPGGSGRSQPVFNSATGEQSGTVPLATPRPAPLINSTDFWAHGLTLGLEINF